MNLFRLVALSLALLSAPAAAQWQTPNHSVPVGRGAGVTGFGNAPPGAAGLPLLGNGVTSDPSFQQLGAGGIIPGSIDNSRLSNMSANTAKCNPTGGAAVPQDCTAAQIMASLGLAPALFSNTFTVDHTIATSDCNGNVQMGTGSIYPLTLTLPAVAGFTGPCAISIVGQASRGVKLSGFAGLGLTSPNILWPQKTFSIAIANGAWAVTRTDGRWQLPAAAGSPFPTSSTTYTLNIGGGGSSDANDGLAIGVGAFATLQAAINAAAQDFDLAGQNLVFQIADGTYTQANSVHLWSLVGHLIVGGHTEVIIRGNVGSLGNVTMAATGAGQHTFAIVGLYPPWRIEGIKFQSTSGFCVSADGQSFLYLGTNDYGVCALGHINTSYTSFVELFPPYTISGSSAQHLAIGGNSRVLLGTGVVTLTGTPAFSSAFANLNNLSYFETNNAATSFSGSATGVRVQCFANSIFQTFGGSATYIPGSIANSIGTGCLYQ